MDEVKTAYLERKKEADQVHSPGVQYLYRSVCCLYIKPFILLNDISTPVCVLILHRREIRNSVVTDCETEKPKQPHLIKVRQVSFQRTWYENITKEARPENTNSENKKD